MMRIALVFRRFALGGSLERDAFLLATGLTAEGIEVHCFCDARASTLDEPGVAIHDIAPWCRGKGRLTGPVERGSFALAASRALRRERRRFDLVHVIGTDSWEGDIVDVHEVMAAAQRRWPSEAGHGYRFAGLRARVAPLTRPLIAVERTIQGLQFRPGRYRRVMAVSEVVRDDLVETFGVATEAIDVVPPPIDRTALAALEKGRFRRALGLGRADHLLLFVGHAFERKGLADALAALAALPETTHLAIVGDGPVPPFAAQASSLGIGRRVHFLGATNEPHEAYADADVLVLPTRHDPWGIPLVEAMAAGVPSVTTPAAGAAHEVETAGAGLVVPAREPRTLALALRTLLANPDGRAEMAARGRRAAVAFGREAYIRAVLASYDRALGVPGPTKGARAPALVRRVPT
jgi:glycosyltransferase involved in cell wall biosynthesis